MTQDDMNFLKSALLERVDRILTSIAENQNKLVDKTKKEGESK